MGFAQLLELVEAFEQSLLLSLVGFELIPEFVDLELTVDEAVVIDGQWLVVVW